MAVHNLDPQRLADVRINEDTLVELRSHRTTNMSAWKARIDKVDKLYRGDWHSVFPDETVEQALPYVMNMVQMGMEDVARLVSESLPSVRAFPESDSEEAQRNAYLREAIAETYWEMSHCDLLVPRLAMDLIGAGACFLVVDTADQRYPCIHRIDPRMAYPDVHDGRIQDLLVHQVMKVRQAARLFPRFAEELAAYDRPDVADAAEVIEYYSEYECVQAVILTRAGKPIKQGVKIVKRWEPDIGMAPVAFAMLDTFDGEFRGMFDQVAGSLNAKNRVVRLILDHADQLVYAPIVSKGLLNPDERPGPFAHYRLDPSVQDAQMGRLSPAGASLDIWRLMEFLEREQRAGVAYPAQRHGQVDQNIASAAFVASTQGQLTTVVRNVQRLLAGMREQLNEVCFRLDERHLNEEKPLIRPVGRRKTYVPKRDIGGKYYTQVIYGAGAGLDRLNADVRVLQHMSMGLISKETAREQIDYLPQDGEEQDRINRELAETALVQKFLAEAPWDMVAKVYLEMEDGKPMAEAIRKVMEEGQEPPPGAAPVPEGPSPLGPPPSPGAALGERLALQKGLLNAPQSVSTPLRKLLVRPR